MTARKDSIPPHVRAAIAAAQEKQAADVILLDLEGLGAFTDYFIVCTGFSARQVEAICEEIEEQLERGQKEWNDAGESEEKYAKALHRIAEAEAKLATAQEK